MGKKINELTTGTPVKADSIIIEKADGTGTFKTTINDAVNSSDVNSNLNSEISRAKEAEETLKRRQACINSKSVFFVWIL